MNISDSQINDVEENVTLIYPINLPTFHFPHFVIVEIGSYARVFYLNRERDSLFNSQSSIVITKFHLSQKKITSFFIALVITGSPYGFTVP